MLNSDHYHRRKAIIDAAAEVVVHKPGQPVALPGTGIGTGQHGMMLFHPDKRRSPT
jgi:hypothetical protein